VWLLLLPAWARAEVRFDVAGTVEGAGDGLVVHVQLRNGGDTAASALSVDGELLGSHAQGQLPAGIAAGDAGEVVLKFPAGATRAGVHPLSLLLDYTWSGTQGPVGVSQRAYLLLGLGGVAEPALRLTLPDARMDYSGVVELGVESLDGAPHSARVRLQGPRGFRVDDPAEDVAVPAHGAIHVPIRVFRGTLPWASRQGILAIVETTDGPLASTAVAAAVVEISPDPAWMPRLRKPLLAAGILLLSLATWAEARRLLG
jgi:hypothetical protein